MKFLVAASLFWMRSSSAHKANKGYSENYYYVDDPYYPTDDYYNDGSACLRFEIICVGGKSKRSKGKFGKSKGSLSMFGKSKGTMGLHCENVCVEFGGLPPRPVASYGSFVGGSSSFGVDYSGHNGDDSNIGYAADGYNIGGLAHNSMQSHAGHSSSGGGDAGFGYAADGYNSGRGGGFSQDSTAPVYGHLLSEPQPSTVLDLHISTANVPENDPVVVEGLSFVSGNSAGGKSLDGSQLGGGSIESNGDDYYYSDAARRPSTGSLVGNPDSEGVDGYYDDDTSSSSSGKSQSMCGKSGKSGGKSGKSGGKSGKSGGKSGTSRNGGKSGKGYSHDTDSPSAGNATIESNGVDADDYYDEDACVRYATACHDGGLRRSCEEVCVEYAIGGSQGSDDESMLEDDVVAGGSNIEGDDDFVSGGSNAAGNDDDVSGGSNAEGDDDVEGDDDGRNLEPPADGPFSHDHGTTGSHYHTTSGVGIGSPTNTGGSTHVHYHAPLHGHDSEGLLEHSHEAGAGGSSYFHSHAQFDGFDSIADDPEFHAHITGNHHKSSVSPEFIGQVEKSSTWSSKHKTKSMLLKKAKKTKKTKSEKSAKGLKKFHPEKSEGHGRSKGEHHPAAKALCVRYETVCAMDSKRMTMVGQNCRLVCVEYGSGRDHVSTWTNNHVEGDGETGHHHPDHYQGHATSGTMLVHQYGHYHGHGTSTTGTVVDHNHEPRDGYATSSAADHQYSHYHGHGTSTTGTIIDRNHGPNESLESESTHHHRNHYNHHSSVGSHNHGYYFHNGHFQPLTPTLSPTLLTGVPTNEPTLSTGSPTDEPAVATSMPTQEPTVQLVVDSSGVEGDDDLYRDNNICLRFEMVCSRGKAKGKGGMSMSSAVESCDEVCVEYGVPGSGPGTMEHKHRGSKAGVRRGAL